MATTLDFREGSYPNGIEIMGEEKSEIIIQRDGSTALHLFPGSYIKVNSDLSPLGGKKINDYTLTMDIMFDSLPGDSAALLQTSGAVRY